MKFWPQLPDRAEEPQCQGRVLHGLRRAQRLAGQHREGVRPSEGPNLSRSPVAQRFRLRVQEALARDRVNLKPIHETPAAETAEAVFEEFAEKWGKAYPVMVRLWRNAWTEFVPLLDHDIEIRKVLCSTNAIKSLNARLRRAVRARGHFPNEQAALKTLYLTVRSLDPKGTGQTRRGMALEAHPEHPRHHLR